MNEIFATSCIRATVPLAMPVSCQYRVDSWHIHRVPLTQSPFPYILHWQGRKRTLLWYSDSICISPV